ncbi:regulatory protein RecX [Microbacterium betulae]|uniref:Regulatory protein RecX n=1 Tax=Microbacterium betulae TaxID=2981139 RepID=A0AA97I5Y8_9MICO|nr:regulatory protein RecX [Microbacterium sp. AB]WOF22020.1 regulatory protein RecX [Microbacterium sp. AB]
MTDVADGGGDDLAPVIPLFGPSTPASAPHHPTKRVRPAVAVEQDDLAVGVDDESGERWHTTWRDLGAGERRVATAPSVTTTIRDGVRFVELDEAHADTAGEDDAGAAAERLLKALRTRSLSVSEARSRLRQDRVAPELIDDVIARIVRVGALDDDALAEQLVHVGTSRKSQGRRAIAQTMASRGIPRDVVDAALAGLPDDDAERALEFARGKAQSLVRYDEATALRRLVGQLGRRGFGGSLAMSSARQALDEARRGPSGVRFR